MANKIKYEPLKVGDRVRYSGRFLHNTGLYTDKCGRWTGTVTDLYDGPSPRVAVVSWDHEPTHASHILECNLHKAGKPEYFT